MVTIPGAPVHFDVTRIALIDALGNLPLGEHLHLEPRGRMADALLAQMPVASPTALASLAAEFDRQAAETSAEADAHAANGDGEAELMAAGASDTWRAAASRARRGAMPQEPQP